MMRWLGILMLVVTLTLLGSGCGPRKTVDVTGEVVAPEAPRELTYDEVVLAWKRLATGSVAEMDAAQAAFLTQRLAEEGPGGLDPILEVLRSPDTTPDTKVLAVISLSPLVPSEYGAGILEQLMVMTEPGHDTSTRACATHLVGLYGEERVIARIRELMDDPERRVRSAAFLIAFPKGMPEAAAKVRAFWGDEETTIQDRDQLILAFPERYMASHLDIFISAMEEHVLAEQAHMRAIEVLAESTGDPIVTALTQASENTELSEAVRERAKGAVAFVKDRMDRGKTGAVLYTGEVNVPEPTTVTIPADALPEGLQLPPAE